MRVHPPTGKIAGMTKLAAALALTCLILRPVTAQEASAGLDQAAAQAALAEAKRELAPDRRTVVFDVEVEVRGGVLELVGEVHSAELEQRLIARLRAAGAEQVRSRLVALPAAELGEQTFGVVSLSVANLRSRPGHSEELGTQALLGTPLRILKQQGSWLYVQTPNDYLCWTCDRIQRMTAGEFDEWRGRDKVIVTETYAMVRTAPSIDATPVSDVVAGCLLGVDGEHDDWLGVRYPDGREGFLQKSAARSFGEWLREVDDDPDRVVATARRFFGVPYLWGGTSTKGMDCSGFTSTVYLLNGVVLPRDASQQVHAGVPVSFADGFDDVQKGDLLFFGRHADGERGERVTHVGISLGGARFIHAATDVHENSLDPGDPDFSAYRKRGLLHIRRVRDLGPEHLVRPLRSHPLYVANEVSK